MLAGLIACGSGRPDGVPAAVVEHGIPEVELPVVTLADDAVARLGIETEEVRSGAEPAARLVGGEVVVQPGKIAAVAAPLAGRVSLASAGAVAPGARVARGDVLVRLAAFAPADRDTRARVEREVSAARASLVALEQRVERSRALLADRSGTERALEEAVAARDVAAADLDAAEARARTLSRDPLLSDVALTVQAPIDGVIRALSVADGQVVAAGAPLLEVVDADGLQVRVPVFAGDLGALNLTGTPWVRPVRGPERTPATFTAGPPTAEPDRGTVDRYLAVPADAGFSPGERVLVELPLRDPAEVTTVAASAVVLDAWGGAWVYACDGHRYTRARVDPVRRAGDRMVLAHGPPVGACVVAVGAAELFGAEFPPGH